MIIEALTTFGVGQFIWEALEFIHLVHVGHKTGETSIKKGSYLFDSIYQRVQDWKCEKEPGRKQEREAKNEYDFNNYDDKTIANINAYAITYLSSLGTGVWILNNAKSFFSKTHISLDKLAKAKHEHDFSNQLLKFSAAFTSFKGEFQLFLLSLEKPNREFLYLANLLALDKVNKCDKKNTFKNSGTLGKFNRYLANIKTGLEDLTKTKNNIVKELTEKFGLNSNLFNMTHSAAQFIEQTFDQPSISNNTHGYAQ